MIHRRKEGAVVDNAPRNSRSKEDRTMPRLPTRLIASLQCFARYADSPAVCARQEIPVAILAISLDRIRMESVADLQVGALVRLRLPAIGWRHVAIAWLDGAKAECEILFPLLPYELRAAINSAPARRDPPPPRKGKPKGAAMPRAAAAHAAPPSPRKRGGRSPLIPVALLPDVRAAGQAVIAVMLQWRVLTSPDTFFRAPSAA
jgi:hypothetical protein